MKKFAGIMVATVLAFSLVACGPVDSAVQNLAGAVSNSGSSNSGVVTADDDGYADGTYRRYNENLFLRLHSKQRVYLQGI